MDELHEALKDGVFAQFDMQIITQAICILCEKNGGKLEIPLEDVEAFQTKQVDLEWKVDNKEKKLVFTVLPVTVKAHDTLNEPGEAKE